MCLNPFLIDNPYRGLKDVGINFLHDCTSTKIPVPCGNCPTCIALRQNYFIQRTQMEALNNHLFMVTLTYKQDMIRYENINGRKLYYADFTDIQKMFKRFRNKGFKDFSYMVCSEYGGSRHRPHFHLIFSVPKGKKDDYHDIMILENKLRKLFSSEWKRNLGSDRKPIYKPLCEFISTYKGRTFDFHYVNPSFTLEGEADVAFYVTKYITKSDKWVDSLKSALKLNLKHEEFLDVWKLLKPRVCISKDWGKPKDPDVIRHIEKGIRVALECKDVFPYFISPVVGKTFPLSPFYQKKFITFEQKLGFWINAKHDLTEDGMIISEEINPDATRLAYSRLDRMRNMINKRLISHDSIYDYEQIKNMAFEELEANLSSPLIPDDWTSDFED